MLKRLAHRPVLRPLLGGIAAAALLAACDQVDLRLDRAKDIADASAGQISGETVVDPSARNLNAASVDDRALAGTVMAEFVIDDEERPMFAIGSIIAKPRDIPVSEAVMFEAEELTAEELEYFESVEADASLRGLEALPPPPEEQPAVPDGAPLQVEKALPKITIDPRSATRTRQEIARAGSEIEKIIVEEPYAQRRAKQMTPEEFKTLPVEQKTEVRKLARRESVSETTVRRQLDANEVMAQTMTRYGFGGEVALSRQGQMVIQIGADGASPTQFRGKGLGPADFIVRADEFKCPDNIQPEQVGNDLALATACVVRDLRASGQFEYVEPDFIFQNQFVRRPKEKPPQPGTGTSGSTGSTGSGGSTGSSGNSATPTVPASFLPDDPLWALQWHFRDRGSEDGRSAGGAGFESFWSRQATVGSRSVVVAVVDTGLQMSHPDIAGSPNIMPGYDMVSDPRMGNDGDGRDADPNDPGDLCDPTKPYAADSFHGTHVAGTVGAAATNNGAGVAGGAWNVRIVPVRALGKCGGRLSDINDGIRWAAGLIPAEGPGNTELWNENPADIINLSIGLLGACPASLQDAIDSVTERGVIVVSAAGNARMSTSLYAPAGCRNVVTVAASDARGQITPYSNFGPEVMLLAPGGDLTRDDNGDGKPDGVLSTKAASNCYDPVTGLGVETCFYAYEQGTSMAAPHVSAALALLKSRSPTATREQLISTLQGGLDPRQPMQCSGLCSQYPGTTPLAGSPDMCSRPCGTGLLNLANIPAQPTGGGGR